jgi:hypothetical protein
MGENKANESQNGIQNMAFTLEYDWGSKGSKILYYLGKG